MSDQPPHFEVQGRRIPPFLYGTAWKGDATAARVRQALEAGFRRIDTANQRSTISNRWLATLSWKLLSLTGTVECIIRHIVVHYVSHNMSNCRSKPANSTL